MTLSSDEINKLTKIGKEAIKAHEDYRKANIEYNKGLDFIGDSGSSVGMGFETMQWTMRNARERLDKLKTEALALCEKMANDEE